MLRKNVASTGHHGCQVTSVDVVVAVSEPMWILAGVVLVLRHVPSGRGSCQSSDLVACDPCADGFVLTFVDSLSCLGMVAKRASLHLKRHLIRVVVVLDSVAEVKDLPLHVVLAFGKVESDLVSLH